MTTLASPIAHWRDRLAVGALSHLFWTYDPGTGAWTLTPTWTLEAGRLADLSGTGAFVLTPLGSIPSLTPVLTMARRADGGVLTYRAS